jgi:hypothetical protein
MHLGTTSEGQPLELAPSGLTTHGVIVGMTGSGKIGLGIVLLEEALAAGVPTLILDPKGDHGRGLRLRSPDPPPRPPRSRPSPFSKQARAFGVGMVLSTQNPVDLDYKAMANARTWMVGRLQTENDNARVLEGLKSAAGDTREQFELRADEAAQQAADAEAAQLRDRLEARQDRLEAALTQARARVEELTLAERTIQTEQLAAGAGAVLGALFGGRRRTRAAQRRRTAEAKAAGVTDDLLELDQELADDIQAIDAKWRAIADEIDTLNIRPEAADVHVERLTLVWARAASRRVPARRV